MKSGKSNIPKNDKTTLIKSPEVQIHNSINFNESAKNWNQGNQNSLFLCRAVSPINLISKLKTDEDEFQSHSPSLNLKFIDDLFILLIKLISCTEESLESKLSILGSLKDDFIKKVKSQLKLARCRLSISSKTPSNAALIESERYLSTVRHKNGLGSFNLNTSVSKSTKASCIFDRKKTKNVTPSIVNSKANSKEKDKKLTNSANKFSNEVFSLKSYIMKAPKKETQFTLLFKKPEKLEAQSKSTSKHKRKNLSSQKKPSMSIASILDSASTAHNRKVEVSKFKSKSKKTAEPQQTLRKQIHISKIKKDLKDKFRNLGKRVSTESSTQQSKELKKSNTNFFASLNLKSKFEHKKTKPKSYDSSKNKEDYKYTEKSVSKTPATHNRSNMSDAKQHHSNDKIEDIMTKVYSNLDKNYYHYLNFSYNEFCANSKHPTLGNSFFQVD